MKINKIEVAKFRNLSKVEIFFSNGLNAIAGQNGTSKTSVLGLIGHIFAFTKEHKTLAGKYFRTEFSEIFKFAYPDYDKSGEHIWNVNFDSGEVVPAVSYPRIELGKKESIRIRVRESKRGSGKLNFPVIYLGMGRLFPLNLANSIKNNKSVLTKDEIKEFSDIHDEVLMIVDEEIIPESISTSSKSFYAPKTKKYNHLGNSAGQDNMGQIITALISFKRLQKALGDDYHGGILLIDELDASLFPAAQIKLVELLDKKSKELNLQIFFTTHSLEVLSKTREKDNSKIIYLDKNSGIIRPKYDLDIIELQKDLLVLGPDALKEVNKKRFVYCEDAEASDMLKCILPKEIKDRIEIFPTKLGSSTLKDLAKRRIPDFKKSIIVLDGDSSHGGIKNVRCLPGKYGPDRLIFDFLKSSEPEMFNQIKKQYTKQFCFKEVHSLDSANDKRKVRNKSKDWYKEQRGNWGQLGGRAWALWKKENIEDVDSFVENFDRLLNK